MTVPQNIVRNVNILSTRKNSVVHAVKENTERLEIDGIIKETSQINTW